MLTTAAAQKCECACSKQLSTTIGQTPAVETGQMSAVETGQMSDAETGKMSAFDTGQRCLLC